MKKQRKGEQINVPKNSNTDKIILILSSLKTHIPISPTEKRYLKKNGALSIPLVIKDIISENIISKVNNLLSHT